VPPALAAAGTVLVQLEQEFEPAQTDDRASLGHVDHHAHDERHDGAEDVERRQHHGVTLTEKVQRPADPSSDLSAMQSVAVKEAR
jgi:hypothetical protein